MLSQNVFSQNDINEDFVIHNWIRIKLKQAFKTKAQN